MQTMKLSEDNISLMPNQDNMNSQHSKNTENDLKLFAELRKQFKETNPGPRDDDWLDDEQFYCENLATWTKMDIPDEILHNPSQLYSYLLEEYKNGSKKSLPILENTQTTPTNVIPKLFPISKESTTSPMSNSSILKKTE